MFAYMLQLSSAEARICDHVNGFWIVTCFHIAIPFVKVIASTTNLTLAKQWLRY